MGLVEDLTGEAADPGLVIDLDASIDSSTATGVFYPQQQTNFSELSEVVFKSRTRKILES